MTRTLILMTLMLSATVTAQGQSADSLSFTLTEAQQYAVEHSYSSQQAKFDVKKAKQKVRETTAIGLPQVQAKAGFSQFFDIPTQVIPDFISPAVLGTLIEEGVLPPSAANGQEPGFVSAQFGTDYNVNAGLSVNQLLFDGSYIVGLQAAKAYNQLATNQAEKTNIQIKEDVSKAYALVVISRENLEVQQKNKRYLDSLLFETEQLYANGLSDEQNVDQLRLLVNEAEDQLNSGESMLEVAEQLIKFNMGIPIAQQIELKDDVDEILAASNEASLMNKAFDHNSHIDYKLALNNQQLQLLNMKNNKAGYLPKLSAFYNYEQNYLANDLNFESDFWFPTSVWGLSLNVPVFTSFMRRYQVQQAQVDYEKSVIQTTQAEQALSIGALRSKANYKQALNNLNIRKRNAALAQKIVNKEAIKYTEGVSTSLQFTQAQNQFLQSQSNYLMAILKLAETKAELDTALNNNAQ